MKDIYTIKQHYETMGNNSIDIRLDKDGKEVFLVVILTDFNPFKQTTKSYSMNRQLNYSDPDFIFYLKKVLQ